MAVKEGGLNVVGRIFSRDLRTVGTVSATSLLVALGVAGLANAKPTSPVVYFLLKPGEVSGIDPGKAQIFRTASAVRTGAGESPSKAEVMRYESEGFVEAAIARIHDRVEPTARGISSVFVFDTPSGAREELKAEVKNAFSPQAPGIGGNRYFVQRRFKVPEVPGAVGFAVVSNAAARKLGVEAGVAKGLFIEGSCLISVGLFRPTSNDVTRPTVSGIQAISERTGTCP